MLWGDFILPESANYVSLFCYLVLRNLAQTGRKAGLRVEVDQQDFLSGFGKAAYIERKRPKSPRNHTAGNGFGRFCVS